jgi:hypothetical protein
MSRANSKKSTFLDFDSLTLEIKFLRNVEDHLPSDAASHPGRLVSSVTPL